MLSSNISNRLSNRGNVLPMLILLASLLSIFQLKTEYRIASTEVPAVNGGDAMQSANSGDLRAHHVQNAVEHDERDSDMTVPSMEESSTSNQRKTHMYTFFERIDASARSTGMSDERDNEMIAIWKEEWQAAGFAVKILTMQDAKNHPKFLEFQQQLQKVSLNTPTKIYNQMCYYRHLAMASVGGGFMSDYDVLPIINNATTVLLPMHISDDSEVVVYSATPSEGGIPCLMSGSAVKWERLAFALLESGIRHPDERLWSDMFAMIDIRDSSLYKLNDSVIKFGASDDANPSRCDKIRNKVAIHFSHHGLKEVQKSANDRPDVARQWLQDWKASCSE